MSSTEKGKAIFTDDLQGIWRQTPAEREAADRLYRDIQSLRAEHDKPLPDTPLLFLNHLLDQVPEIFYVAGVLVAFAALGVILAWRG